jgi:hypothetical protein
MMVVMDRLLWTASIGGARDMAIIDRESIITITTCDCIPGCLLTVYILRFSSHSTQIANSLMHACMGVHCDNVGWCSGGELQLENAKDGDIRTLLQCFQGSDVVLCVVNIGYVFGVHCRHDNTFVVFDTHRYSLV